MNDQKKQRDYASELRVKRQNAVKRMRDLLLRAATKRDGSRLSR
jgi:hypothetical protein